MNERKKKGISVTQYSLGNFLARRNTLWISENDKQELIRNLKQNKHASNLGMEEAYGVGRLKETEAATATGRRCKTDTGGLTLRG